MAASILLSDLAWSTPDGRPVFSHLNLAFGPERCGLVGRNGVGKTSLLRLIAGEARPAAGAVAVTGRVGVLRQSLDGQGLAAPEGGVGGGASATVADLFGARAGLELLARAEAGLADEDVLAAADWTLPARLEAALAGVGLSAIAPEAALSTLSGGQRTRAALAALVFAEPDWLLLDEPTNNLDAEGRAAVADLLAGWRPERAQGRGMGAIVVSHDRGLLETMDAVVELTSLGARRYGGGWSRYAELKAAERAAAAHALADAEKKVAAVQRSAQTAAERKARRDGAGQRAAAKGGAPRIVLGMMKNRAEQSGGAQDRLAERQAAEAQAAAEAARAKVEVVTPLAVALPPTGLAAGKTVLELEGVSGGYAPGRPVIRDLSLKIVGPERVAVGGPNGSGKTTLLALIAGTLAPWRGRIVRGTPLALLDQQAAILEASASVRDNFLRLHPGAGENACRAALARFGFRADSALQTVGALSGGQRLRAGLACVLGAEPPGLLILDEPTNHLDLDSIAAVEAGIASYDGALIVVSHDEAFLAAVGVERRVRLQAPR